MRTLPAKFSHLIFFIVRQHARAERALEVGEHDDGDRRVGRAPAGPLPDRPCRRSCPHPHRRRRGPERRRLLLAPSRSRRRRGQADDAVRSSASTSVIAASILALKASNGCAPDRLLPLMKKAGVPPLAPIFVALGQLLIDLLLELAAVQGFAELIAGSGPLLRPYFSRSCRPSACWLANSLSCICQNLPCSLAARLASAARCALSWKGSGSC